MNILVVCHYGLYSNFSNSFVHAQATEYVTLGHRVRVIVPIAVGKRDWEGNRFSGSIQRRDQDGVELYLLRYLSLSNFGKEKGINRVCALRAMSRCADKLLKGFAPDIIHTHTLGTDSEIGAWLKERLGVPLVVTSHGGDTFIPYEEGRRDELSYFAGRASHLVCVSSLLKRRLEECGVLAPISIILNGFRIKNTVSQRDRLPLSFIQAGYLVSRKKANITIRAFAKLCEKYPDASLSVVGIGPEMKRFQSLCGDLGVERKVRFHGGISNAEVLAEMSKSHFFVMPSVNEGFGIVYLEAMASGCVTIGTEGEGIADVIVSGENGFLVPPDDPDAIVQTVEWCLGHPNEAAAIAERGRRNALELTWEKNAAQYIGLFKSLTGRKQGQ